MLVPRIVESLRCISQTKNHRRCKNRTLRSNKCWIHLQKDKNLRIKNSTTPKANFGLFSGNKPFDNNKTITRYDGDISHVPIEGEYVLEVNPKRFIDARKSRYIGGFSNSCRAENIRAKQCKGNNVKFVHDRRNNAVNMKTLKKIRPKEELFTGYNSRSYWTS